MFWTPKAAVTAFGVWLVEWMLGGESFRKWLVLFQHGEGELLRHDETADQQCLDEAIDCFRSAASIPSLGVGLVPPTLGSLGIALRTRFELVGNRIDLDDAVDCLRRALELGGPGAPRRAIYLNNLSNVLRIRFQQIGDLTDLDQAIALCHDSLDLTPVGHSDRYTSLFHLANILLVRFEQVGHRADLDQALVNYQHSLDLIPLGHPDRHKCLLGLASVLLTRFQQIGECADLDQAIAFFKEALELTPSGDPGRSLTLLNLATALLTRFEQVGDSTDLDQAIAYYQCSLELTPTGRVDRYKNLINLANAILTRYHQLGDHTDLEQAINFLQGALELTPLGHSDHPLTLLNLATAIFNRFEEIGDTTDLEQAIIYYQRSLELRPIGHPDRFFTLLNLGNAFMARFGQIRDRADLDQAVVHYQGSLDLTPPGHPTRPKSLLNLTGALLIRFLWFGNGVDLDWSLVYCQDAIKLMSPGNPYRSLGLTLCAEALKAHLELRPESTSRDQPMDQYLEIIALFRTATLASTGGTLFHRLRASLGWARVAVASSESSALEAYHTALELLEILVATGRSLESRHTRLTLTHPQSTHTLAVDAAACAFNAGRVETAVEILEQGRNILLAQVGKYRTRIDELRTVDAGLADRFVSVSRQMEGLVVSTGTTKLVKDSSTIGSDDIVARYIQLSEQWTATVDRIRSLDDFKSFLRPTPFATLRTAAINGPVILLNISRQRSDAIILKSLGKPLLVPLPDATPQALNRMVAGANAKATLNSFDDLLKETWERLVHPVVQALRNNLQLTKGSRIWWCPTGPACHLPLHAAGIYTKRDHILPDIYISSYTSTLSALIHARKGIPKIPKMIPNLLVIGQANTPGQVDLPSVRLEIDRITSTVPSTTTITGSKCTREAVLQALPLHTWTHIACHGSVDQVHPFRSHFSLQDGPMTLLDIVGQNLPNAELAFLAACHSAGGNLDRPDEVLHLTAGLQFAGVRSVVGTLWAMSDNVGPIVSEAFYSNLLGDKGSSTGSSAHALHRAVSELRRRKPSIPSSQWACFVHYGC